MPGPRQPSPVLIPIAIVAGLVLLVGGIFWGGHRSALPGFLRSALTEKPSHSSLNTALDQIANDYYRVIPRSELENQSIAGAVRGLKDRFSNYYDPAMNRRLTQAAAGHFAGVGMSVSQAKKGLIIVATFAKSPARAAGLRPGDTIVGVDGESIAGRSSEFSTSLIKGPPGSKVTLTVKRRRATHRYHLTRANIKVPVIETRTYHVAGKKVAWIHLDSFESPGTHAQVGTAARTALAHGAKGILFDLRGNPGGLLDEAVLTASVFVPKGRIVSTRGRHRPTVPYDAEGGAIPASVPVVVLIDRGSASSAEIVAGAMHDHHRATLVGTRSFGKGVFQEVKQLPNGGALAITVGQFFLPNGENLGGNGVTKGENVSEGKGLKPDVYAKDNLKTRKVDEAIRTALRVMAGKLGG